MQSPRGGSCDRDQNPWALVQVTALPRVSCVSVRTSPNSSRKVGRRGLSCLGKTPRARLCKSGPRALTGSRRGGGPLVPSWVAALQPQAFVQRRSRSRRWSGQGEAGREAKALPFRNASYEGKFAWGASGSVCILEIGRKVQVFLHFLLRFPQTPSAVRVFLRDSHDCLQGLQTLPLSWSFHRVCLCGFQQ